MSTDRVAQHAHNWDTVNGAAPVSGLVLRGNALAQLLDADGEADWGGKLDGAVFVAGLQRAADMTLSAVERTRRLVAMLVAGCRLESTTVVRAVSA
eukprot:COSAG01_NODE_10054_length_2261_cov_2.590657_2_plen_96_part_00